MESFPSNVFNFMRKFLQYLAWSSYFEIICYGRTSGASLNTRQLRSMNDDQIKQDVLLENFRM